MTVLMVLAVWFVVSVPVSIAVGCLLKSRSGPELIGMVGSDALYVCSDGRLTRVPVAASAAR